MMPRSSPIDSTSPTTSAYYTLANVEACEKVQRVHQIPPDCEIIDEKDEQNELGVATPDGTVVVTSVFVAVCYRPKNAPEDTPGLWNWANVLLPLGTGHSLCFSGPEPGVLVAIDLSTSEA